jgi:hypothetical protein
MTHGLSVLPQLSMREGDFSFASLPLQFSPPGFYPGIAAFHVSEKGAFVEADGREEQMDGRAAHLFTSPLSTTKTR